MFEWLATNKIFVCLLAFVLVLGGCATGPNANPSDPFEPMNRGVYRFNTALDDVVLKPVAKGYKAVTPSPIRQGISNFFSNLGDVWSLFNHVLQAEFGYAGKTLARLGVNTFVGLGGILDIATDAGVVAPKADFGQTLGKWGVPSGPYVVLPLLGPSSVRDGVGTVTYSYTDPVYRVSDNATRNVLTASRIVNARAQLLNATDTVDQVALDKYTLMRDLYLKRRQLMVKPLQQQTTDDAKDEADDVDYSAEESPVKVVPEAVLPKLPPLPNLPSPVEILK